MKNTIIILIIFAFPILVHAENSIQGIWKDKSNPDSYQYEFKENNDFVFTSKWEDKKPWETKGRIETRLDKGVWETGGWEITKSGNVKSTCNLTIYAGSAKCCFDYKFIGNNLIMSLEYKNNDIGSYSLCENRVLVKEK